MIFKHLLDCEYLGEFEAIVNFDYQPAEPMVTNPDAQGFGPGCAAEASVTSVVIVINGTDQQVMDIIPSFYMELIEEAAVEFVNSGEE